MAKNRRSAKILFFGLTLLTGIIIIWPLGDFQHYLSQGDHGRDLYCFKQTMEGALPYHDYSWLFGPLMPYYYSLCYFIGGVSVQTVLVGQNLLILLTGLLVYLACATSLPLSISFVCALWYWGFRGAEFFHTYNHIGGLLALLTALYCALQYIHKNRLIHVTIGFLSIFFLLLIRLNMGVAILFAFFTSLLLTDLIQNNSQKSSQRRLYAILALSVLGAAGLIYWFLLHALPGYAIYQSFPYGKSQRTDYSPSVIDGVILALNMITTYFKATLAQTILGLLLIFSTVQSFILIASNKFPKEIKQNTILTFSILFIFFISSAHEFMISGVFYRLYWIFPVIFIIVFHLIATATKAISSPGIKLLILITMTLPAFFNIQNEQGIIRFYKKSAHQIHIGTNKIYTTQTPQWIKTVTDTTNFIQANAARDETILVLPFDPLYLFLSERKSATRQLIFFDHIKITEEQEHKIIEEMNAPKANWAIISNRAESLEPGMGSFGKTYCLLLAEYLRKNFIPVAQFGDKGNNPGWAWNHGVTILKKK